VDALDLHVEQRGGVDAHAGLFAQHGGERLLVGALHRGEAALEGGIARQVAQLRQQVGRIQHARAERIDQQVCQARIALHQPAAE
jgi:hypothetical protein